MKKRKRSRDEEPKKKKKKSLSTEAPKGKKLKDPYALDDEAVAAKAKEVTTGSNSAYNRLDPREYVTAEKKVAKLRIRIAPIKGKGRFWKTQGRHWNLVDPETGEKTSLPCPRAFRGDRCPICERASKAYKTGSEEGKALFKKHMASPRNTVVCFVNGNYDEPLLYDFTQNRFAEILDYVQNPDYGNMAHPVHGYDLIMSIKKAKAKNQYPDLKLEAGKDSKIPKSALKNLPDLDELFTCPTEDDKNFYKKLTKMVPGELLEFLGEATDDDEDEAPRRRKKPQRKKYVDDDDEEDDDDEDDDEDERPRRSKKNSSKRSRRVEEEDDDDEDDDEDDDFDYSEDDLPF